MYLSLILFITKFNKVPLSPCNLEYATKNCIIQSNNSVLSNEISLDISLNDFSFSLGIITSSEITPVSGIQFIYVMILSSSCLSSQLPETADRISQGSINRLIIICATIGASILRSDITYTIASNPPRTVVDNITGRAILNSPLRKIQVPCTTPKITPETNTCITTE